MSAEAVGYVFRHSPHTGAAFQVHLAIADSVNDQHANELWMATSTIAKKARIARQTASEALGEIVAGGGLEVVEDHRRDRAGKPSRYRFLFPVVTVYYESRGVTRDDTPPPGVSPETTPGVSPTATRGATTGDTNPREPNGTDGGQAHPAPPAETLDGMPLAKGVGLTYAETLARWLGCSADLPVKARRDESYALIIRQVDCHVPSKHPKRRGVFLGILRDYVTDVCEAPLNTEASKHLSRIYSTYGPQLALRGLTLAVLHGAGLGDEWEADPKALTKYANAVLAREAVMA